MSGHGEAKGMAKLLQQCNIVIFMHFLTDVVVVLSKVSLSMQSSKATLAEAELFIKTSITTLESYKITPGPCLANVLSNTITFRRSRISRKESCIDPIDIKHKRPIVERIRSTASI